MKKRLICALLAIALLVGLFPMLAVEVSATSTFKTGDKCIEILKEMEGFAKYPIADGGQYTVGHGSRCPADKYEYYKANGITLAEADALMRVHLATFENAINTFADKHDLKLTQNMFDALILFTYNCGNGWTAETDGLFYNAVVKGLKGNDFIYAIGRWSKIGSTAHPTLINRRLAEAAMYLNGSYSRTPPSNYGYVLYNNNGGVNVVDVQCYDTCDPVAIKAVPTREGYRFLGWYSTQEGGKWVTTLDSQTKGVTLFARWQKGEGALDGNGKPIGTACDYVRYVGEDGVETKALPDASLTTVATLTKGTKLKIVTDYIDANNVKWGRLDNNQWVILSKTTSEVVATEAPDENVVNVMVTANDVNIRDGAGVQNKKINSVFYGKELTIVETKVVGEHKWGRFDGGWICLMYTNYDAVLEEMNADTTTVTAIGVVVNTDSLRIRSGPGAWYNHVGNLARGTEVEITQQQKVNGTGWGRIASGWICLQYVQLRKPGESAPAVPTPGEGTGTGTGEGTGTGTGTGAGTGTVTPPTENKPEETPVKTGVIANTASVNIRSAAGTKNNLVCKLPAGTKVQIFEEKTVDNAPWARIKEGWVCMYYVQVDAAPGDTVPSDGSTLMGTVINTNALRVRSGAGMNNAILGTLTMGTQIKILERTTVNGKSWGRYSGGWVCMDYIKLRTVNVDSDAIVTGTVINTNALRIRANAGLDNAIIGTLTMGTKVAIYEQKVVGTMTWGRIDQGWISLSYVRLDSADGKPGSMIKTVNTASLRIRQGVGVHTAHIGNYTRGTKVEILEITTLNGIEWGRTDKGWICLIYVI